VKRNRRTIIKKIAAWTPAVTAAVLTGLLMLSGAAGAHEGMEHFRGTVVSVGENLLRLTTTKGTAVEVRLDPNTRYSRAKQRVTLSDVEAGSRVVVHAMKMNGALVAHEVSIGVKKPIAAPAKKTGK
jgi:hypothetical protein